MDHSSGSFFFLFTVCDLRPEFFGGELDYSLAHDVTKPTSPYNLIFQKYQLFLFFTFNHVVALKTHYLLISVFFQELLVSYFGFEITFNFGRDGSFANGELINFRHIFVNKITSLQNYVLSA